MGRSGVVRGPNRGHVNRNQIRVAHDRFNVLDVLEQASQTDGFELQTLEEFERVRIGHVALVPNVRVVEEVIGLVHHDRVHVIAGAHDTGVTPKIQTRVDGHKVHGTPHRFQCSIHRNGQVVPATEDDGDDAHLDQFSDHGLHSRVSVLFRGSGSNVSQIHGGLPPSGRDELIQPMPDRIRTTCTPFVVSGAASVVDAKKRDACALQHRLCIKAVGFDAVCDPGHAFRVGEVRSIHRFEQIEKSVEHEQRFYRA